MFIYMLHHTYRILLTYTILLYYHTGQERYANFDELYTYCYRVAGTVGLMTLPILGTAEGYTVEEATEPAVALGN